MDDKEIKRMIKDVILYLKDTEKSLAKHPDTALVRFGAAEVIMGKISDALYDKRPLGGKE